jgi:hypothetical protein
MSDEKIFEGIRDKMRMRQRDCVECIYVAQDRVQWLAVVKMVVKLVVS